MVRVLQINVDGGRAAQDLMEATAAALRADILIISEPYRCRPEEEGWFRDSSGRAAVAIVNPQIALTESGPGAEDGFRWVQCGGQRYFACYWSPNTDFAAFEDFLIRLERSVRSSSVPVVVAGDFNAKSPAWGDSREDAKGRALADWAASLDLAVCNQGARPTFTRAHRTGISSSSIDITFVSRTLNPVADWKVLDDYTGSLHRYIMFDVAGSAAVRALPPERKWSWRKLNPQKLQEAIDSAGVPGTYVDAASGAEAVGVILSDACAACMPSGRYRGGKRPVFWWTPQIAELRKVCLQARRKYTRCRPRASPEEAEALREEFRAHRSALRKAIRDSKEECWKALCRQVDTDPWGLPYKLVTKKLYGRRAIPGLDIPGRMENIVSTLFPAVLTPAGWPALEGSTEFPEITSAEVACVGAHLPRGKAPGPDGVPDIVVGVLARRRPDILATLFNVCLREGEFPERWKVAKLVLLRKGDKPLDSPSAYRPICLLDSVGKLFERLLKVRIEGAVQDSGGFSDRQYGFRRGRSAVDAIQRVMGIVDAAATGPLYKRELCAVVALDVQNAFNSARWDRIESALRKRNAPGYIVKIVRSYLSGRTLRFNGVTKTLTCGVPQGSVPGPLLWNILYDGLLGVDPGGNVPGVSSVSLVAFADDLAVVATGHDTPTLEDVGNQALTRVAEWMAENGLALSTGKSEAVVLTSKRGYAPPAFAIDGVPIRTEEAIRYLGVRLHRTLGFKAHLQAAAARAQKTAMALWRIMPNVGGAQQRKRRLLASVVESVVLYAAPVWAGAMVFESNTSIIQRPQRTVALRVATAYRTVSTPAVLVIAGMIPVHLLAEERRRRHSRRGEPRSSERDEEDREEVFRRWQEEWSRSEKGTWTRRLIGDVRPWVRRAWGQVDFHLTQLLSGHGCFGHYLARIGKAADASCADCQAAVDDAEHAFFQCGRWWQARRRLEMEIGADLVPETLVGAMLASRRAWEAVQAFANHVMAAREEDERRRQRERPA
ncbi:Endonuclease/exonuclease/phosphatase,Reverse transcriptase domain [Cinara cedri]|uniref:Endonuclease/exonuclease/phosphatase,Reverse transcriptase domain n=1 Tax=Cinara cedri TaxID=506608 RepID=A0A5E4NND9_9HEMI|nr:Endonuclease/exonuclease/phosphatase,Reverse transcriptase domain [Cinara cedri]